MRERLAVCTSYPRRPVAWFLNWCVGLCTPVLKVRWHWLCVAAAAAVEIRAARRGRRAQLKYELRFFSVDPTR